MKKLSLLILLLNFAFSVFAQENYAVDLIPANLKSRANATIRSQETIVDMRAEDNVIYSVKKAITVFNKNGDDNARLVLGYDKNIVIKGIKGEVYNEMGILTHKFSQNDFRDESAIQDISLFEDSRVKHFLPNINNYPYTVVYTFEIRFKQNLIIPEWVPKRSADVSVAKSSFTFISKPNDQVNIKVQNLNSKADEFVDDKQKRLIWTVNNLPATKVEPFSPLEDAYQPSVKIAPKQFRYFNYQGSYTNWQELGKWQYDNLLKDRQTLSPQTIETVKNLIKDETNDKDRARKIYQYMQNKTRYISIQVGIGGFQPFKASEVDRLGYGDCKALVNYMQSLLAVANIESYYCVVNAGSKKVNLDPTFASMEQGNHIILCMPLKGDTTWLECTSQKIPFGFLSDFTDDRYVLACTPTGGKLLHTPKLTAQNNLQTRKANITLDKEGNAKGTILTTFEGSQYDAHEEIIGKPLTEQQKLLKDKYDVNNIYFSLVNYEQEKAVMPKTIEKLSVEIRNYCSINNDKFFIMLNPFNVHPTIPEVKNRTMPVYINRGFTDIDSVTFQLPENVIPIALPNHTKMNNEFGSYESSSTISDGKLHFYRKLVINEGNFPPESYAIFTKFITEVNSADQLKLTLSLKK